MSYERWVNVGADGSLELHTENDGWSAKNGLDPHDRPITLEDLLKYSGDFVETALKDLLHAGFAVDRSTKTMRKVPVVHLVIECWGCTPSEVNLRAFADHGTAMVEWKRLIREYLDGSDRDANVAISGCWHLGVFHTSDGFISVVTEEVDASVIGMSAGNTNAAASVNINKT